MTDYAALIKATLIADATLLNSLTGSVYTYKETGRLGISRTTTPNAFDATTKKLKPCAVVKARSTVPDNLLADDGTQEQSVKPIIEIWLYEDGGAAGTISETARARVYALLQGKQIGGIVRRVHEVRDFRDPDLDHAQVMREDYEIRTVEGV